MKKTAEEIVNRLPRSSEYPLYVHESDVEQALEEYKDQHTAPLIEALERINSMREDTGRPGCTYNDTDFDSQSVVYGYNIALNEIKDKIHSALLNAKL